MRNEREIDWIVETAQKPETCHYRRFEDWYREEQDQKSMEREALKVSTIRNQVGWTHGGMFKRVASWPLHIFMMIRKVHPEFARNSPDGKRLLYKILARYPMFTVRQ